MKYLTLFVLAIMIVSMGTIVSAQDQEQKFVVDQQVKSSSHDVMAQQQGNTSSGGTKGQANQGIVLKQARQEGIDGQNIRARQKSLDIKEYSLALDESFMLGDEQHVEILYKHMLQHALQSQNSSLPVIEVHVIYHGNMSEQEVNQTAPSLAIGVRELTLGEKFSIGPYKIKFAKVFEDKVLLSVFDSRRRIPIDGQKKEFNQRDRNPLVDEPDINVIPGSSDIVSHRTSQRNNNTGSSGNAQERTCDSGCKVDNTCVPVGFRVRNGNSLYCNLQGELVDQKQEGLVCQNDFECSSNSCVSGECKDLAQQVQQNSNLLQRIAQALSKWL